MQRVYKRSASEPKKEVRLRVATVQSRIGSSSFLYLNDVVVAVTDTVDEARQAGANIAVALTLLNLPKVDIIKELDEDDKS